MQTVWRFVRLYFRNQKVTHWICLYSMGFVIIELREKTTYSVKICDLVFSRSIKKIGQKAVFSQFALWFLMMSAKGTWREWNNCRWQLWNTAKAVWNIAVSPQYEIKSASYLQRKYFIRVSVFHHAVISSVRKGGFHWKNDAEQTVSFFLAPTGGFEPLTPRLGARLSNGYFSLKKCWKVPFYAVFTVCVSSTFC